MVVTGIHCLKLLETMNKDEEWCHYSGMPSPKQFEKSSIYQCQMCNGPITAEEYYYCDICPNCLDGE